MSARATGRSSLSDGYGLQARGRSLAGINSVKLGVTLEGFCDGVGSFSGECDSLGHVVGQRSLAEDGKAEEVDLGLSDSRPSHLSTSLGSLGLDFCRVKDYNSAVTRSERFSDILQPSAESHLRHTQKRLSRLTPREALSVFWRWIACGHGRHRWQLMAALDNLGSWGPNVYDGAIVLAVRSCARCGTTEVVE